LRLHRPHLIPYTTRFRSHWTKVPQFVAHPPLSDGWQAGTRTEKSADLHGREATTRGDLIHPARPRTPSTLLTPKCWSELENVERSEEHTSELQSRFELVC